MKILMYSFLIFCFIVSCGLFGYPMFIILTDTTKPYKDMKVNVKYEITRSDSYSKRYKTKNTHLDKDSGELAKNNSAVTSQAENKFNTELDKARDELAKKDSIMMSHAFNKQTNIEYIAVINDGITKRTVNLSALTDSLEIDDIEKLGDSFAQQAIQAVSDRNKEIKDKNYYKHTLLEAESNIKKLE